jgi:hypothetical protein
MTDLQKLLFSSSVKSNSTHTRIPDKDLNIYGGNYSFNNEDDFYKGLYDFVFRQNKKEYLTEKQIENGTFVIDLDFRYSHDVKTRQHTKDNIDDIVYLFTNKVKNYVQFDNTFRCYVMQKPNVNRLDDGSKTKDGIHLLYTFELNDTIKQAVRKDVIKEIPDVIKDLPLINSWEDVIDEGVIKRSCNWNIYGCSKPANERYEITDVYEFELDRTDNELMTTKPTFVLNYDLFRELSVRTRKPILQLNKEGETLINKKQERPSSPNSVVPINMQQKQIENKDKYLELLDIIGLGNEYILHPTWFNIGSILKTNGYSKSVFEEFTKQYVCNKENELDKIWEYMNTEQIYSIFGLQKIAKKVNLGHYNEWFIKNKQYISIKIINKGNNDIAKFISKGLQDVLVWCNKNWIIYDERTNLWRITDAPNAKVCNYIQKLIDYSMETLIYKINRTESEDEKKTLKSIQAGYENCRMLMADNKQNSMIIKFLKDYLNDNDFYSKLDINKYKIAYKNGILDLKTHEFREGLLASDYLTQTIPYNYERADKATIDKIRFELLKICNNNKTHLEYYLSALGYAMTGDSMKLQEFYYIIGQKASNGKSVVFEALNEIIPCYCKKIESNSFEKKNSNLHKEIATWKGIRIGWINELTKAEQDPELIKQVCDGTSIKYKVMYGISDMMAITFKPFIISNHSPTIDADAGIARRLKMFQMDSEFIEGLETDDFENCRFKRDSKFAELLRNEYKFALMDLIYSYSKNVINNEFVLSEYPCEWNEVKKECLIDNNPFAEFIIEHFEFGNDYQITEHSLKQYFKLCKINDKVKFTDEVKKNKWNIKRGQDKIWRGFKIKEVQEPLHSSE